MTAKNKASIPQKVGADKNGSWAVKNAAAQTLTQRPESTKSYHVTAKSGKAISRTVLTHRDALKRLADR